MTSLPSTFTGWLALYGQVALAIFCTLILVDLARYIFRRKE